MQLTFNTSVREMWQDGTLGMKKHSASIVRDEWYNPEWAEDGRCYVEYGEYIKLTIFIGEYFYRRIIRNQLDVSMFLHDDYWAMKWN